MRYLLISLGLLFAACEEPVLFTEPQPAGTSPLDHFPKRWQGEYLLPEDSSRLEIGPRMVRALDEWDVRATISDLDSTVQLVGDTVLLLREGERMPVIVRGDSVFGTLHVIDTLFALGEVQVLKRMAGSLFMNRAHDARGWEVSRMTLSGGRLRIAEIRDPESMAALNEVMELPGDTLSAPLMVSRKQFRGVVKRGGFVLDKEYVRTR